MSERKVYTLLYADDVVMMAEEEGDMRCMMARLERYLQDNRMELNVRKTKILWFIRGGGKLKKCEWRWRGEKIEEVKAFDYLGYRFQINGGQEGQVRERVRKVAAG